MESSLLSINELSQNSIKYSTQGSWVDLFIDELGEKGCDSFEETPNGFNAYIPSIHFTSELEAFINALSDRGEIKLSYILEEIPSENWNKVWESSFEPIIVGDWCAIIAPFHSGEYNTQHYVKISPKMSFGTGHHETTYMMVQNMQSINLKGKMFWTWEQELVY